MPTDPPADLCRAIIWPDPPAGATGECLSTYEQAKQALDAEFDAGCYGCEPVPPHNYTPEQIQTCKRGKRDDAIDKAKVIVIAVHDCSGDSSGLDDALAALESQR